MLKPYLNYVELCFISLWLSYFSFTYEYFTNDPIFWYRCKLTIGSLLSIVIVRYDERTEHLERNLITEAESNAFFKLITLYDLSWILFLWFLRFQLPTDFVEQLYNFILA